MSLINELKNYKQCDEDGVMCEISRQAIEEAISYIEKLEADRDQLEEWLERGDSHVMELVEENEKLRDQVAGLEAAVNSLEDYAYEYTALVAHREED